MCSVASHPPVHLPCSELEKRKSGAPGRFVLDDPVKYPAKDDIGFFGELILHIYRHHCIAHIRPFDVFKGLCYQTCQPLY
jgi:hypothetical protein